MASPRRLSQPKRNRRWLASRIFNPNHTCANPLNPIRSIAELKDITGETLDRKVFIQSPDESL